MAPSMLPVSSISSIITTTAGFSRVGWKTESPVRAAVSARSPIRFRAHCRAPMMRPRRSGLSACSPAAVTAASGSQDSSSPLPAAFSWTRMASSIAVIRSRSTSSMLVFPPPVIE